MRLEGSLDAFGLPDILQLLAFTAKTGALHIRRAGQAGVRTAGVVHVCNGAITSASSDVAHQALARRVVAAGLVGDDALREAVTRARSDTSTGITRVLLDSGAVVEEAVLEVAREQAVDAVCELLRWSDGDFSFLVDQPDADGLPVALPVEEVVAEGRRRLDAWPTLTALISSPAAVMSLSLNPPGDPSCSREEWALLSLVDGRRTVGDIVSLLGRGEFAIVRALAALVERGLLVAGGAENLTGGLADLVRRQGMLLEVERPGVGPVEAADRPTAPPPVEQPPPADVVIPEYHTPAEAFVDGRPVEEPALAGRVSDALRVEQLQQAAPTTASAPPSPAGGVPAGSGQAGGFQAGGGQAGRGQAGGFQAGGFQAGGGQAGRGQAGGVQAGGVQAGGFQAGLIPSTSGTAALDPLPVDVPLNSPAARPAADGEGQDSIVTKSLLLRLIAGVRGL